MKQIFLISLLLISICKNSAYGQNLSRAQIESKGIILSEFKPRTYSETSLPSFQPNTENSILQVTACEHDTLLFEDFENKTIPASWPNLDLDGHAEFYDVPQNWFIYYDEKTSQLGIDTNWVATSSSYFVEPGTASNWLILDPVTICSEHIHLQWKSAPNSAPYYMDGYKVLISTTDNSPASFTDTVAIFAEDMNGSGVFSEGIIHPESHHLSGKGLLYEYRLSLQQYQGQQIYIAFVHDSEDDDLLKLDDILVAEIRRYDISFDNLYPDNGHSIIPRAQINNTDYTGYYSNKSYTTSTEVTVSLTIEKDLNSLHSQTYAPTTMAPASKDTINMSVNYQPTEVGTYIFTSTVTGAETDPIPSNNSFSVSIEVSDSVYARDNGIFQNHISFGTNTTGFIGQTFNLSSADSLSTISFHIADPVIGDTISGEIFDFSGGEPFPLIPMFYTDTLIISDPSIKNYTLSINGGKKFITPGNYMIGLREAYSSMLTLGMSSSQFPNSANGYVLTNGSWRSLQELTGIKNPLMLRANFTGSCPEAKVYGNSVFCTGKSIKLTTDSTFFSSIQWKKDGINLEGAISGSILVSQGGTYSVETSSLQCPVSLSEGHTVTEAAGAIATLTADKLTTECDKDTVTLEASGASSFVWLRDEMTLEETGLLYKTVVPGNYVVIANAGQVCADTSDIISIVQPDLAPLTITGPTTIEPYTQDIIYSVGGRSGSSYSWLAMPDAFFMGDGTPTIKIDFGNTSGNIEVTERSANGCMYFASKYVEVTKITSTPAADNKILLIYPNPFSESFNFSDPKGEVTVFSTSGHVVDQFNVEKDGAIGADWIPGVYILQIKHDNKIDVLRVVKTK